MNRPLAVFDVDGTRFKSACVEKTIDAAIEQRVFDAANFEETMAKRRLWQASNNEGVYQAYLNHMVGAFMTSITGVEVERFNLVIDQVVREHQVRQFSYTRNLAHILKASHEMLAISGSPEMVVKPMVSGDGFDRVIGSTFEVVDGHYTGLAVSVNKEAVLEEVAGSEQEISVAVGDTIGDKAVLERAICPIVFNPSATLRRFAREHRMPIVLENKDAVTQLIPRYDYYEAVFDSSPSIILDYAGVRI